MLFLSYFYSSIIHYIFYFAIYILHFVKNIFDKTKRGWDKSPSLSIIFGLSSKTQWLSGLYYADFISFYSPTQLCGGGTTKSNSNELPISVPLSYLLYI
ncbi:Peptide deformylase [Streptococcus sp. HSISM1]|nr:Peptide deformylase [Streptococcus sp. HSISM1]